MSERCRIYDSPCVNPAYCARADACCAGDPDCKPQHCALGPQRCSQCAGAVPAKIEVIDGTVHVDGAPTRQAQPSEFGAHRNTAQGAARRARRRR